MCETHAYSLKDGKPCSGKGAEKYLQMEVNGHLTTLCRVETWGFDSCAVMCLMGWNNYIENLYVDCITPDEMFRELNEKVGSSDWWGYRPGEAYFLISTSQLQREFFKKIVANPNVSLRDKFKNKSHGPNDVFLYRWSLKKDFE